MQNSCQLIILWSLSSLHTTCSSRCTHINTLNILNTHLHHYTTRRLNLITLSQRKEEEDEIVMMTIPRIVIKNFALRDQIVKTIIEELKDQTIEVDILEIEKRGLGRNLEFIYLWLLLLFFWKAKPKNYRLFGKQIWKNFGLKSFKVKLVIWKIGY